MTESVVKKETSKNTGEYDEKNIVSRTREKVMKDEKEKIFETVKYKNGVSKRTLIAVIKNGKVILDNGLKEK